MTRAALCALTVLLLALAPGAPAWADEQDDRELEMIERVVGIVFDLMVLRPMGAIQTALGAAILPVAYTLAYPNDAHEEALDILLKSPADFAFGRPLGEF